MLEAIRNQAQGWIVKVILGLIVVTFALFGIDSYMSGQGRDSVVAEVGKQGISRQEFVREIQDQTERMREALGPNFDIAATETADFRKQVLDRLIERKALLLQAQQNKFIAPDAYVASILAQIPAFQEDGVFSQQRYEAVLRQNGRTPAQFENDLRQSFMLEVATSPVSLASFSSKTSSALIARLVSQQREIAWTDIAPAAVESQVKITPADIERHYSDNAVEFTVPEQILAEYVVLDLESVAAGISVAEQAITDFYQANAAQFGQPEQRSASHILIAADPSDAAARSKARARATELYETVSKSPARFAELARAESQDPGSAEQGGSLGSFGRGMMVKPFEDAVFSMKPNEIRGPIETDFGYHIIRLDGIDAAKVQPLAEVRDQVVAELRKQEAQKQFADLAENFSNLVYENADSLDSAAAAIKTKVQRSDWVTQQTVLPPLNHAAVVRSLFSAESIKSKQNTEAIEVAPGQLVAARVVEHRPSTRKPLAEVSAAIEQRLRREQIDRLLSEKGAAMIKALAGGEEPGVNWSPFQLVSRQAPVGLDAAGAKAVFSVATDKLPAYTGFTRPDGTFRIVRVSRVIESPSADPLLQASIESGLQQAQQRADLAALVALVKAGQKVKILPNALEEQ